MKVRHLKRHLVHRQFRWSVVPVMAYTQIGLGVVEQFVHDIMAQKLKLIGFDKATALKPTKDPHD